MTERSTTCRHLLTPTLLATLVHLEHRTARSVSNDTRVVGLNPLPMAEIHRAKFRVTTTSRRPDGTKLTDAGVRTEEGL